MIYGDPIILGGGGSGGPTAQDAILLVTVPAGSTVTATKSGVTVTPTLWVSAADSSLETALFVFAPAQFDNVNPWTITATDGTNTASTTVLITTNKEYEVTLSYHVPPEYQEVQYIIFPAGAYIDTLVNANISRSTEIKISDETYVNDKHYIGGNQADGFAYHFTSYNNQYFCGSGSNGEVNGGAWASGEKVFKYNDVQNNFIPTVNGQNIVNSASEITRNYNIWLGRRGSVSNFSGNMYYCYIRNNADYSFAFEAYPCYRKSDSVVGLWDKVSETLFVNAGAGALTAGPDVNRGAT